jgi:hypothetical protein
MGRKTIQTDSPARTICSEMVRKRARSSCGTQLGGSPSTGKVTAPEFAMHQSAVEQERPICGGEAGGERRYDRR